ncbi:DUF2934 domain-containing protein [Chloroflexota bacterium]
MIKEDEIRIIAYRIWEKEGCCAGHDCEHWLKAEVIWEKEQTSDAVSVNNKAETKHVTKQSSKHKNVSKHPARSY